MSATKEIILEKGKQILLDLGITNYYKEEEPAIEKTKVLIFEKNKDAKEKTGWYFTVGAYNWQFENQQGAYSISFLLDGTPHRISDLTGGRGMSAFVYMDNTENKYKAVSKIEELP